MKNTSWISVNNVSKRFKKKRVLRNICYDFFPGQVYVIQGSSGCGKSTLLSLLSLLDKPTQGSILYYGKKVKPYDYVFRKENISCLFDGEGLFPFLTGKENLELVSQDKEKIQEYVSYFDCESLLFKKASILSKGERMRLSLIRTLLLDKPILLLDEPTSSLDPVNKEKVYALLKKISQEKLVILVSHDHKEEIPKDCILLTLRDGTLEEKRKPIIIKDEKEPKSKITKDYFFKTFRKSVPYFLKKHKLMATVLTLFAILLSFLSINCLTFSKDRNYLIEKAITQSPLEAVRIQIGKEEDDDRIFKSMAIDFLTEENESLYLSVVYSKAYEETTLSIPDFLANEYNLEEGETLKVEEDNNLRIDVHIREYDLEKRKEDFKQAYPSLDESTIDSLLKETALIYVPFSFARSYLPNANIYLSDIDQETILGKLGYDTYIFSSNYNSFSQDASLKINEINMTLPLKYENLIDVDSVINEPIMLPNIPTTIAVKTLYLKYYMDTVIIKNITFEDIYYESYEIEYSPALLTKIEENLSSSMILTNSSSGYLHEKNYHGFDFFGHRSSFYFVLLDYEYMSGLYAIYNMKSFFVGIFFGSLALLLILFSLTLLFYTNRYRRESLVMLFDGQKKMAVILTLILFSFFLLFVAYILSFVLYGCLLSTINMGICKMLNISSAYLYANFGFYEFASSFLMMILILVLFVSIEYSKKISIRRYKKKNR